MPPHKAVLTILQHTSTIVEKAFIPCSILLLHSLYDSFHYYYEF